MKPRSSEDLYDSKGLKQRRYYDSNVNANEDIDYDHSNADGSHTFPHRHKWIRQHREIEFEYENKQYAFLAVKDGFVLVCDNKTQGPVFVTMRKWSKKAELMDILFWICLKVKI